MARPRSAEFIPADRRTRRRLEWEDTRRPAWVMWLSVACIVALVAAVVALSNTDRMSRPTAINGDMLGPDTSESVDAYVARAQETLVSDGSADGDGAGDPRWALVSPDAPAGVNELTAFFTPHPDLRVSTLLSGGVQWPIAEPAVGHRREDVFESVRHRVTASSGKPDTDEALQITGIVVRGTTAQLQALASTPGIKAVEALASDAAYGRFGMRPLTDVAPQASQVPESQAEASPDEPSRPTTPEVPAL